MTSILPFEATDLLELDSVNLDVLTENYGIHFYMEYLLRWPDMFLKSCNASGKCTGYMIGKTEGLHDEWHSHITAVTVNMDHRRIGLAGQLVDQLVKASNADNARCNFMDLFVRTSNSMAISMYRGFGFKVFRRVIGYYCGGATGDSEDAYDMRKRLDNDIKGKYLQKTPWTEESPYYDYKYGEHV